MDLRRGWISRGDVERCWNMKRAFIDESILCWIVSNLKPPADLSYDIPIIPIGPITKDLIEHIKEIMLKLINIFNAP